MSGQVEHFFMVYLIVPLAVIILPLVLYLIALLGDYISSLVVDYMARENEDD